MNKALLIAPALLIFSSPALSQNALGGDGKDSSYPGMGRDLDEIVRAIGESGRGGLRRGGAAFFLRTGDSIVAVRCDPQDSMRSCVESTLTLLDKARSAQSSGMPPGGGAGGQPQSR
jgi:hypothetical protein